LQLDELCKEVLLQTTVENYEVVC